MYPAKYVSLCYKHVHIDLVQNLDLDLFLNSYGVPCNVGELFLFHTYSVQNGFTKCTRSSFNIYNPILDTEDLELWNSVI